SRFRSTWASSACLASRISLYLLSSVFVILTLLAFVCYPLLTFDNSFRRGPRPKGSAVFPGSCKGKVQGGRSQPDVAGRDWLQKSYHMRIAIQVPRQAR